MLEDITLKTEQLVDKIFTADEKLLVISLLIDECGLNMATLPTGKGNSKKILAFLERIRFAVLKLSEGNLTTFERAIKLANIDWRDLLVYAGFESDINAHNDWANMVLGYESKRRMNRITDLMRKLTRIFHRVSAARASQTGVDTRRAQ